MTEIAELTTGAVSCPVLNTIEALNPLDASQRRFGQLDYVPGRSLEGYFPSLLSEHPLVIAHNGRIVPPEERALVIPEPGDYVVFGASMAGGGGGGKAIFRIVAMIAITVMSGGAAAGIYAAMGGTFVAAGAATSLMLIQAGVVIAGSMLVNALLPPPKASTAGSGTTSPTYGVDGAKNTSAQNLPVPLVYGRYRYGGNIVNNYVVNDGDTQYLHILMCLGEGPIGGVSDILINDEPLSSFKEVQTEVRLGGPDQTEIPWFAGSIVPVNQAIELSTDWHYYTTDGEVDQLRFDFIAPAGLSKNGTDAVTVPINIEYAPYGTENWQLMPGSASTDSLVESTIWKLIFVPGGGGKEGDSDIWVSYVPTGAEERVGDEYFITTTDANTGQTKRELVGTVTRTTVAGYTFQLSDKRTAALRRSFSSAPLTEGRYRVRVRRGTEKSTDSTVADVVQLSDINEITNEKVGYQHTALLGVRIKLTDQLSGFPTITHINNGKVVMVWNNSAQAWDWQASSNPAWIALDILTNKRYGGGEALARFDLEKWKEWAEHCDDYGLEFNGVFDTITNVWEACAPVFRAGHAQRLDVGTRRSVVIERAEDPRMMFSVANIIKGSFKENWLSMAERANEVEVTFNDAENNYKPRTLRIVDTAAIVPGVPQRTSAVTLQGVTSAKQAWKDGRTLLNMNRLVRQSVEFAAPLEAIGCTVGSVVLVQHDMPQWGYAGRLEAGSTRSDVVLDRPVTMKPGVTYKFLAHFSAAKRYTGTIASIMGNGLVLNGYDGGSVQRIVVGGRDLPISTIYRSGLAYAVTVADAAGIAPGAAYELWETDAIETRTVANPAALEAVEVTTLHLTAPLSSAPEQFSQWMFGENTKVAKPFRIKTISGTHEYRRDIVALEYDANVYNPEYDGPALNYSDLDPGNGHVTNLSAEEEIVASGTSYYSRVTVRWEGARATYKKADVYLSRNGAPEVFVGSDRAALTVDAGEGDILVFRVVAISLNGEMAPISSAPTIEYVVAGYATPPEVVANFSVTPVDSGWFASWAQPASELVTTTQIRIDNEDSTAWSNSVPTFTGKATSTTLPFMRSGVRRIRARHAVGKIVSQGDALVTVTVLLPGAPSLITKAINGRSVYVTFANARTSQPLAGIEFRACFRDDPLPWDSALVLGQAGGAATSHAITFQRGGEYSLMWRAIDMAGNAGPIVTTDVDAFQNVAEMLDALEGRITRSQLAQDLLAPIDSIQGALDDVQGRITLERDDLAASQITGLIQANEAIKAARDAAGVADDALMAVVDEKVQELVEADSALASRVTTVAAGLGQDITAAVLLEEQARVTADNAQASQTSQMIAQLNSDLSAMVLNEESARVSADEAASSALTGLTATVGSNYSLVSQRLDTLSDTQSAHATTLSLLTASVGNNASAISSETTARADADSALGSRLDTMSATVGSVQAAMQTSSQVSASISSAIASNNTTLRAEIGTVSATASNTSSVVASLNGNLSAQSMMKVDVLSNGRRVIAGIAVGVSYNSAGTLVSSEVLVNANTFAVVSDYSGNATTPFIVNNGNVYIRKAFIQDADIDTLKIAGQAVTVPVGGTGADRYGVSNGALLQRVWINTSGAQVFVTATFAYSDGVGVGVILRRDGTQIYSAAGGGSSGFAAACVTDYPGAGSHFYDLILFTQNGTPNVFAPSIMLLEVKR